MKHGLFVSTATLCFMCMTFAPQAMGKETLYQSAERATIVKSWIRDFFSEEPVVKVLPITIPGSEEVQFFTESDLRSNESLLSTPDVMNVVEASITEAYTDRQKRIVASRTNFLRTDYLADVSFEVKRPIIFVNPSTPVDSKDLRGVKVNLNAPFNLRGDVLRLVDNKLFTAKFGGTSALSIPSDMEEFINSEFSRIKAVLPGNGAKLIAKCKVHFITPQGQKLLWLGSDELETTKKNDCPYFVTISPLLVRAIFVRSVGTNPYYAIDQLNGPYGQRMDVAKTLLGQFARELHFVLSHEIGHLFYDIARSTTVQDEACIDSEAYLLAGKLDGRVDLGAFKTILEAAVDEHHEELWSLERSSKAEDIRTRVGLLSGTTITSLPSGCVQHFDFGHLTL